jgi:putative chitinase
MNYNNLTSKINSTEIGELQLATAKFNITTPLRLCHFLSQCSHESGNFVAIRENLNYSIKGLMGVFGKYFTTEAVAKLYERQPQKIANRVYANRMGNGDEASGDGYNYRGRGYIQLTGKDNYKAFATFIGEDVVAQPDLVATKYPLTSAGFFFNKNKLWSICDKGETIEVITELTKRINGGTNGLDDRIAKFRLYKSLI